MNVAVGRPLNCSACARMGPMSSPSSAPTAQAMLSSTFRFSVRIGSGLISAMVAPTTKSATSSTMYLCVMALGPSRFTTVESSARGQRRPRPNAYLRSAKLRTAVLGPEDGAMRIVGRHPPSAGRSSAPGLAFGEGHHGLDNVTHGGTVVVGAVQQRPRPHRNRIGHPALPKARRGRRGVPFRRLEDGHAQSTHMRVEGVAGDTAVVDFDNACTGVGGEFVGETV